MEKVLLILTFLAAAASSAVEFHGRQLVSFTNVQENFVSDWIRPGIPWDQLVASWNFRGKADAGLKIEAQVAYDGAQTKWYCLGKWALQPGKHPRESVKSQQDEHGSVATDTLKMKQPGGALRVRVTTTDGTPVDFLTVSFCDSKAPDAALPPNTNAWGRIVWVEPRTQADFPEGINEWCSPTATSMILHFWSKKLNRPDLDHTVPETARAVNDPNWPGTGNWPFNTAFAGSHPGLRACVARFSDVSEIEDWICSGIPIAFSVSYGLLKGNTEPGNGHILVAIGFTKEGNILVNDPGRRQVRQVYTRDNLVKAWAESENTVYLIFPEGTELPRDRFSHWP